MTADYFIGKDKFVHKVTERDGFGDPLNSLRAREDEISETTYIETFLLFLGFAVKNLEEAQEVCPFTVEYLKGQYLTLYKGEDVEVEEETLHMSLREVGRQQKKNSEAK